MPLVHQNLPEQPDHIPRYHVLGDVVAFDVAGEVEDDADHQVSESIEVYFVGGLLGDFPFEGLFEFFDDDGEEVFFLDELGDLLDAVFVGGEVEEDGGGGVLDLDEVGGAAEEEVHHLDDLLQEPLQDADAVGVAGAELEDPRHQSVLMDLQRQAHDHPDEAAEDVRLDEPQRQAVVHLPVLEVQHDVDHCPDQALNRLLLQGQVDVHPIQSLELSHHQRYALHQLLRVHQVQNVTLLE
mmetsp:Transcript_25102/g.24568  ORF Transcript_25102/g.24568 Transcript_25102/m.24568 type:complete len:239 (-) Transcript_25102:728-1444(-)